MYVWCIYFRNKSDYHYYIIFISLLCGHVSWIIFSGCSVLSFVVFTFFALVVQIRYKFLWVRREGIQCCKVKYSCSIYVLCVTRFLRFKFVCNFETSEIRSVVCRVFLLMHLTFFMKLCKITVTIYIFSLVP